MKLTELKIENFRSFKEKTIRFDDYTCFVGANSSGKSNILTALNIFFQNQTPAVTNTSVLKEEDFHHKKIREPIKITLTFENLSEDAQKEFQLYYRQDKLIVFAKAEWNEASKDAAVKQYGSRLVMKDFSKYFEAEKNRAKVDELKNIYSAIREKFPDLPKVSTGPTMVAALREYEENHPKNCELIDEENQLYGFTGGKYKLDKHIQWIYVPAVKDASIEQEEGSKTALGKILERTVRAKLDFTKEIDDLKTEMSTKYFEILSKHEQALQGMRLSIEKRLQEWITNRVQLNLKWHYDGEKSINVRPPLARAEVGDGDFIGEVQRAGHGLQRGFLLALLQELAGSDETSGPMLLLAVEEPELYQHPPQSQHFAYVLEKLSEKNSQIIITTHSPYFVQTNNFERIRIMRKSTGQYRYSNVFSTTWKKVEDRLKEALGEEPRHPNSLMAAVNQIMFPTQKELFFSKIPVLVEGIEDVAYIATQFQLDKTWNQFRTLGCHLIPVGNKCSIARFIAIAQELEIPYFVIVDGDADTKPENRENNLKDNACLLKLLSYDKYNPEPEATIWEENFIMWKTKIGELIKADFGEKNWQEVAEKARSECGFTEIAGLKNQMLISAILERLFEKGFRSANLTKLLSSVLRYAECLK